MIAPSQREKEIAKLKRALAATRKDIEALEEETRDRIGDLSRLLTIYQTFLDDATIITPIVDSIRHQNLSAQTALHRVLREFAERFLKMGEPFANYAPELLDLERRVQARLLGNELVTLSRLPRPVVDHRGRARARCRRSRSTARRCSRSRPRPAARSRTPRSSRGTSASPR